MPDRSEYRKQYYKDHHCIYRKIATEKLGRGLRDGEEIHHIDVDGANNDPENLYIYGNHSEHSKGHWSLNKLIAGLLRDDIVKFEKGRYKRT